MTKEKVLEVFARYRREVSDYSAARADPKKVIDKLSHEEERAHVAYMCEEGVRFVEQGRMEKAMRWLGFLQGWLWKSGRYAVQELGEHSMPDEAKA